MVSLPRLVFSGNVANNKDYSLAYLESEWNISFDNKRRGKGNIFSLKYNENLVIKGELRENNQDIETELFVEIQFSLVNFPLMP
jgi:hypothetical protein